MKNCLLILGLMLLLIGCKNKSEKRELSPIQTFSQTADTLPDTESDKKLSSILTGLKMTYPREDFLSKTAITFTLQSERESQTSAKERFTLTTNLEQFKIERPDRSTVIYHRDTTYLYPPQSPVERTEEELWRPVYIFSIPFRFSENEKNWQLSDSFLLEGEKCRILKRLSPGEKNIHKILLISSETGFIKGLIYGEESAPEVVLFDQFFSIGAIPFAKNWSFYQWNNQENKLGAQIGTAQISKVKFLETPPDYFKPSVRARQLD